MGNPSYANRHGEIVEVVVTGHALRRFLERWELAFPSKPLPGPAEEALAEWFAKAQRFEPRSRKYKARLKRHGKDTLYFKAQPFVFVVQSASIKTVELGDRDLRPLNKARGPIRVGPAAPPAKEERASWRREEFQEPKPLPLFKLTGACATGRNAHTTLVNLGSYDSKPFEGKAERLRDDAAFRDEVLRRFRAKRPGYILRAVSAILGNGKDSWVVLREDEIPTPQDCDVKPDGEQ